MYVFLVSLVSVTLATVFASLNHKDLSRAQSFFFLIFAFSLDTWPEGACGKKIFKGGGGGGAWREGKSLFQLRPPCVCCIFYLFLSDGCFSFF